MLTVFLQELEFLSDNGTITQAQLRTILNQLPEDASGSRSTPPTPAAVPTPAMANLNMNGNGNSNGYHNEKANNLYNTFEAAPPPAYPATPQPPVAAPLTYATALYNYQGGDAGDLALNANDRVAVLEYMNADWWKGRNERTSQEGIFPRNYVKVEELKSQASNYGNAPLDVAQGGGSGDAGPGKSGKGSEMGKKMGKKVGNAALFGAGATIGSKIVGSIF